MSISDQPLVAVKREADVELTSDAKRPRPAAGAPLSMMAPGIGMTALSVSITAAFSSVGADQPITEEMLFRVLVAEFQRAGTQGIPVRELNHVPRCEQQSVQRVINLMLAGHFVEMTKQGDEPLLVYIDESERAIYSRMTPDEKMVYQHIKNARNKGIWLKDIKSRASIHAKTVSDCIKSLEKKSIIKSVKSIKNPTKRVYMLYNMVPSEEVTGGTFYTDLELDTSFISLLSETMFQHILSLSNPQDARVAGEASEGGAIIPLSFRGLATTASCLEYLETTKVSKVPLSLQDVQMLLDYAEAAGIVERRLNPRPTGKGDVFLYRAFRAPLPPTGLGMLPCARCDSYDVCSEDGKVSPQNCGYYTKFLEF